MKVPIYNFVTHQRENRTVQMYGANVIIFEGIFAFHDPTVRSMLNMKVFVDTDADLRLCRRLKRDTAQRGRDCKSVLEQYERHVKPAFKFFIAPTMTHADIIVPRGGENSVAIDLIVQHVRAQMVAKGHKLRSELVSKANVMMAEEDWEMPSTLRVLPMTPQIRGLHTFIRNMDTPRDEFMFYSKRLIRLIVEHALSLMPYEPITVKTPQGGYALLHYFVWYFSVNLTKPVRAKAITQPLTLSRYLVPRKSKFEHQGVRSIDNLRRRTA